MARDIEAVTAAWDELIIKAGHQASQDFDAWVLKLGTAGLTVVLGVAALVQTTSLDRLVWAGGLFAGALVVGLLSLRLSADGLTKLVEGETEPETGLLVKDVPDLWQFRAVMILNWLAVGLLSVAFAMLAVFLGLDAIPRREGER
jgi:hypothetical protein